MIADDAVRWIFYVIAGLFCLYILKAIRLARDGLRPVLRNFAIGFLIGMVYYYRWGQPTGDKLVNNGIFFGIIAAAILHRKRRRRRSPKLRRQVIARDFKDREHEYDPKKHHIDHKWAFSKGGGDTLDNLRVIDKTKNLRKGAKWPSFWDMFFR
jgi:hypothetical protein